MPNWTSNSLTLTGPKELIKTVWDTAQDPERGLLNSLRPMPNGLRDTVKGTGDDLQVTEYDGYTNWYDWAVNCWGTKWDISIEGLEYVEDNATATINGWFESAWAPPIAAFEHFAVTHPLVTVQLDYHEAGSAFVGRLTAADGFGNDEYFDYSCAIADTVRELIGAEFDDMWNISENMAECEMAE